MRFHLCSEVSPLSLFEIIMYARGRDLGTNALYNIVGARRSVVRSGKRDGGGQNGDIKR